MGLGEALYEDDIGLTMRSGHVLFRGYDGEMTKRLHDGLNGARVDRITSGWPGEFCVARYEKSSNSFFGVADFSGLSPLYYIDNEDFFAISNRQMWLNPICTRSDKPEIDTREIASYISHGNKFGSSSIYKGVKLLLPGEYIESNRSGWMLKRSASNLWDGDVPGDKDYDEAVHDLLRSFNWLNSLKTFSDQPIPIALTGGEDSRLVLSLALSSDLRDRVETFTYGYEGNPDLQLAPIVAQAAGVVHKKNIFKQGASGHNLDSLWDGVRRHAFRFEGAPGGSDGGNGSKKATSLELTGLYAEFFKRVRESNASVTLTDTASAFDMLYAFQQPYDSLDLLTDRAKHRDATAVHSWIDDRLDLGATLNDLPELYYQENRIAWWAGAMNTNISRPRLAPLAGRRASAVALKQSIADRKDRRFIFEAMLRTAPKLMEIEYLGKHWPARFQERALNVKLPNRTFEASPHAGPTNTSTPWTVYFAKNALDRLVSFIQSRQLASQLEPVIDLSRLQEIASNPSLINNAGAVRAVVNLAELAIIMAADTVRDPDDIENHNLSRKKTSNIPEIREKWSLN